MTVLLPPTATDPQRERLERDLPDERRDDSGSIAGVPLEYVLGSIVPMLPRALRQATPAAKPLFRLSLGSKTAPGGIGSEMTFWG